jgi:hypothetical protein
MKRIALAFALLLIASAVMWAKRPICKLEKTESGIWVVTTPEGTTLTDDFEVASQALQQQCGATGGGTK